MPYSQYKDTGKSVGRMLHQLYIIGIPITIVDSVIFGDGKIFYSNAVFATYIWNEKDVPIFDFILNTYNDVQKQYFEENK